MKHFYSKKHEKQLLEEVGWCFSAKGKEKEVCNHLVAWLKSLYSNAAVYIGVTGMKYGDKYSVRFRPDIDVMLVTKDEVMAYEVKLSQGQKNKYLSDSGAEITIKEVPRVDTNVYVGIGEALFNLLRCDYSYLVVPKPMTVWFEIREVMKHLPIGLVSFDQNNKFSVVKEAPKQEFYLKGDDKNKLLANDRDRILEIVWQGKGKLDFSKKEVKV